MPIWVTILIAILGAIGGAGGIATIILLRPEMKKRKAEACKVEADAAEAIKKAALDLIQPLQTRIENLEAEVQLLKKRVDSYLRRILYLMAGIKLLHEQVRGLGHDPAWEPDDWDPEKDCK